MLLFMMDAIMENRKFGSCRLAGLEIILRRSKDKSILNEAELAKTCKSLRERYWIQQAANTTVGQTNKGVGMISSLLMEPNEIGRTREKPGDGFGYIYQISESCALLGRSEWFEVTEVFGNALPEDVEQFMQRYNNPQEGPSFDSRAFLKNLKMGIPSPQDQLKTADEVFKMLNKKFQKTSYKELPSKYGYGSLIVGLPLWFATLPFCSPRGESQNNDFMTLISRRLEPFISLLEKTDCPFWRIIVIWTPSLKSIEQRHKERQDFYSIILFELVKISGVKLLSTEHVKSVSLSISISCPDKIGKETGLPAQSLYPYWIPL